MFNLKIKWKQCLLIGGILVLFVLLAIADTPKPVDILAEADIPPVMEGQSHYLLVCVDEYNAEINNLGNTDGIAMVTLDSNRDEIMFTTFMREELVQRPDGKIGRITYITKEYGIDALLYIIGTHYGVRVSKYILLDWNQVANIVDAVGGVDVELKKTEINWVMEDRNLAYTNMPVKLDNGLYHCTGRFLIHFMRIRKIGDSDFGRTDRIRSVLAATAEKSKNIDYNMAYSLLETIMENTVMSNVTLLDGFNVISTIFNMGDYTVRQLQMPQKEDTTPIIYAGMDTEEVDFVACRVKVQAFLLGE